MVTDTSKRNGPIMQMDADLIKPGNYYNVDVTMPNQNYTQGTYVRCEQLLDLKRHDEASKLGKLMAIAKARTIAKAHDIADQLLVVDNGEFDRSGKEPYALVRVIEIHPFRHTISEGALFAVPLTSFSKQSETPEQLAADAKARERAKMDELGAKRLAMKPYVDIMDEWAQRNGFVVGGARHDMGDPNGDFRIDRIDTFIEPDLQPRAAKHAQRQFDRDLRRAVYSDVEGREVQMPLEVVHAMLTEIQQLRGEANAATGT